MTSLTAVIVHSSSGSHFSEKLMRKGFPNLKTIDVVYGFEESLFVTSTIPPSETQVGDIGTVSAGNTQTDGNEFKKKNSCDIFSKFICVQVP